MSLGRRVGVDVSASPERDPRLSFFNEVYVRSMRKSVFYFGFSILVSACVTPVEAPVANPGPAVTVNTGAIVQLDGSASFDPQGKPLSFAWRFRSLPGASQAAFNNPAIVNPSFIADVPGTYEAELVVGNGVLGSAPALVAITASACGSGAPMVAVTVTPASVRTGTNVLLAAATTDTDNDGSCNLGQTFTYDWNFETLPAGSTAMLAAATARQTTFTADVPGTYTVQVTATDSTGRRSAPVTASITASTCGSNAPVISLATASTTAPNIGQPVWLGATFDDADNSMGCVLDQSFIYAWHFVALPAGSTATLNEPTALNPSFTPDVAGNYLLAVTITDSTGRGSNERQLTITASACGGNTPFVATLVATPNNAAIVNQPVQLGATVSDADNSVGTSCDLGQTLTYAWSLIELPAGSSAVLNAVGAEDPSFTPDVAGSYVVRLHVTDSTGRGSNTQSLEIIAGPCGSNVPVAIVCKLSPNGVDCTPPASTGQSAPVVVQVDGSLSNDADNGTGCLLGQTLTYSWQLFAAPAGSTATLNLPTGINPSFRADVNGAYIVRLNVSDGIYVSAVDEFTINVP